MTDVAIDTELPGTVQTTDLDTSESVIAITGRINGLPLSTKVTISGDDDWIYNSEAGGSVDMPLAADEELELDIPFGQTINVYAKAVATANIFVLTGRACRCGARG